ncbi:MAG: COG4315 family predicted lipoprotein [Stellaceae bacterium]
MRTVLLMAAVVGFVIAPAFAANMAPATPGTSSKGPALVDGKQMTLYTFDKDTTMQSNCNGTCASNWPPLMAPADAKASGEWTVVTRADGSKQWAYKGHPLYGFVKDSKAGDAVGDGLAKGTWHIAKP